MSSPATSDRLAAVRCPLHLAVVGGALWVPYGVLELVQPWGAYKRYDGALGYDLVTDRGLHHLTSLPGSLALLLCALALPALLRRLGVDSRTARVSSRGAVGLAVVSGAGVLVGFDPAFTGPRILGTVLLGVGLLAAARAAGRTPGSQGWRRPLLVLGLLAVSLIALWPLVLAVQWLAPAGGAAVLALHGLGWTALGAAAPAGATR